MDTLARHRQKYICHNGINMYQESDNIDAPDYIPLGYAYGYGDRDESYGHLAWAGGFKSRESLAESYYWATVDAEAVAASMAG